jgi:hypothetical protein
VHISFVQSIDLIGTHRTGGKNLHIPPDLVVAPWTSDGKSASHRHFLFR